MSSGLTRILRLIGPAALLLAGAGQRAAAQYSVFHPVPRDKMRELTTDRPDKTESPITVDAGHVQIEVDGLTFTIDHPERGMTVHQWSIVPMNLKVGVLDRLDLQFVVEPATGEQVRSAGVLVERRGLAFGDITGRLKLNISGDNGGKTAFGVMPFVTSTPVDGHRRVQGGVIFPFSVSLSEDWDLGTMVEWDRVVDDGSTGTRGVFVSSLTVGHALSEHLGVYGEFYSEAGRTPWIATADAGITLGIGADLQFDAGINLGLTHAADDVNPFVGFSVRF